MYTKYLNLVQAVRSLPTFPALDAVESRMLNTFAAAWHDDKQITVLEAMVMLPEISTTTAHRRLKMLRQKGMIDLSLDAHDNRVKYVVPTKVTQQYFAQLGQCMEKAQLAS
jgi:DNA-binding MarR family transcriptional regulator